MALFKVENLTYYYPETDQPALQDINLKINEGEFILLMGNSGCGKSTLLRAFSGLLTDFYGGTIGGSVSYRGKNLAQWPKAQLAKEVGFVFQDPEQQLVMTNVEREIAFGLENIGTPPHEIRRRIVETMQFLNISHLRGRSTQQISGGQKQTVVLASVIAMQPNVLLLDEPTSQLDPVAAEEFLHCIKKISSDLGITIIIAEQRLERCLHLADRVLVLEKGRLLSDAAPAETVKTELKRNEKLLPAMMRFFAAAGCDDIPLTVGEGRKRMTDLRFIKKTADCTSVDIAGRRNEAKLLELKNVNYTYPQSSAPAVKNVSLNVAPGEFTAVVGENGSGKSTLLKTICGLLRPQRGRINAGGRDAGKISTAELARIVGYLSQNPNDYLFHDTVYDEAAFSLKVRGLPTAERVEEILRKLNLDSVRHVNPRDLSGGERQRVALAAVLVLKPQLLLLDEPTRGLDAALKQQLGTMFKDLTKQGAAVIMVSHDIEFIAEHADRVIIMSEGEIVADGERKQIMNRAIYYAPQINKLFRGLFDGIITFNDAAALLSGVEK